MLTEEDDREIEDFIRRHIEAQKAKQKASRSLKNIIPYYKYPELTKNFLDTNEDSELETGDDGVA